jgi:S1-C subfamily serine protease
MERYTKYTKYIRTGLAGLLLAMVLLASGMAIGSAASGGSLAGLLDPQLTAAPATSSAQVETTAASSAAVATPQASTQAQTSIGVLDATSAVSKAGPAVVTIVNTQSVTTGRGRFPVQATGIGSGVIVDSRGYIVTNYHVVEGQQSLEVIFSDGSKASARLVGSNAAADIAVVKVDIAVPAVAEFGNSDTLEPGQPVVAIGSALGDFRNTVTAGVVSALHRNLDDTVQTDLGDLIQTDAAINEGNSGGPLIDLNGQVVGINVAVVRSTGYQGSTAEGLGFAIPANTARQIAQNLISQDGGA